MKTIMTIGGSDSSGGAGLTRDAFVSHRLGCEVLPIVTAVTAQSHEKLFEAQVMPAGLVAHQIRAALATTKPAAIKIGMLGKAEIAEAVADAIRALDCPLVLDPVLKSTSGGSLFSGQLPQGLLSQAALVTPNLPEAAALSGRPEAHTDDEIAAQAAWFFAQGTKAVLIKGGHGAGDTSADHLFSASDRHILAAPRLSTSRRGTGCALATAIACHLAEGGDLYRACVMAKEFIQGWLGEAVGT